MKGLGILSFSVYLGYDYWYNEYGPGKEEAEHWDKWMHERHARLHGSHHDDHSEHHGKVGNAHH